MIRKVFFITVVCVSFLNCSTTKDEQERTQQMQQASNADSVNSEKNEPIVSWTVKYFTDGFGDKTNKKYITNTIFEDGFVTNIDYVATTFTSSKEIESKLKIHFIVTYEKLVVNVLNCIDEELVSVEKGEYTVNVKDCENRIHVFLGRGVDDMLVIDDLYTKKENLKGMAGLRELIQTNDSLKFQVEKRDYDFPVKYQFSLKNIKELNDIYYSVF